MLKKRKTALAAAAVGTPVERPVGRLEPARDDETPAARYMRERIAEQMKPLREAYAPSQARPNAERCPYCHGPAPGWSSTNLWRGWRMEGDTKHYHCRETAVED